MFIASQQIRLKLIKYDAIVFLDNLSLKQHLTIYCTTFMVKTCLKVIQSFSRNLAIAPYQNKFKLIKLYLNLLSFYIDFIAFAKKRIQLAV